MIVLGLDPGSRVSGYGIISVRGEELQYLHSGVIRLEAKPNFPQKLHQLEMQLSEVFKKFKPKVTVVEKVFLGKNADSAFKLGHARGVCLMQAAKFETETVEVAARKAKKLVTGSGSASKDEVQFMVQQLLRIKGFQTQDESDALGLCLAFWKQSLEALVFQKMQRMQEK